MDLIRKIKQELKEVKLFKMMQLTTISLLPTKTVREVLTKMNQAP